MEKLLAEDLRIETFSNISDIKRVRVIHVPTGAVGEGVARTVYEAREHALNSVRKKLGIDAFWHEFSVDNRKETRPPGPGNVWVYDPDNYGVTIAHYDHITPDDNTGFFRACNGDMLVNVTHWAEIEYPDEPEGVDD